MRHFQVVALEVLHAPAHVEREIEHPLLVVALEVRSAGPGMLLRPEPHKFAAFHVLRRSEVPGVLFEAGWHDLGDEVWVTIIDRAHAIRRAMERDGQLIYTRRGTYAPVDKLDLIRGRISVGPGDPLTITPQSRPAASTR